MSFNLESVVKGARSAALAGAMLTSGSSLEAAQPGYFSQAKTAMLSLLGYHAQGPQPQQPPQPTPVEYHDSLSYRRSETTYQSPQVKTSPVPTHKDNSSKSVVRKKKKKQVHHHTTSNVPSASSAKPVAAKPAVKPAAVVPQKKTVTKQYKSEAPAPLAQPPERSYVVVPPQIEHQSLEEFNYNRSFTFGTPAPEKRVEVPPTIPDVPRTYNPVGSYVEGTLMFGKFSENFSTNTTKYDARTGVGKTTKQPDLAVNGSMFKLQLANYTPRTRVAVNFTSANASDVGSPAGNYSYLCGEYYTTSDLGLHADGILLKSDKFPIGLAGGASLQTWNAKTWNYQSGETSNQNNQIYGLRAGLSLGEMNKSYLLIGPEITMQPITEKYQGTDGVAYTARATTERTNGLFAKARYMSDDRKITVDAEYHSGKASTQYSSDSTSLITKASSFNNLSVGVGYNFNPKFGVYAQMKTAQSPADWQDALKRQIVSSKNDGNSFNFGVSIRW